MALTEGGLVTFGETMVMLTNIDIGPLRHARQLRVGIGGAESNVAIGVRRLGEPAAWIGRVGDDDFGALVLETIRGQGVDVEAATVDPRAPTGLMIKSTRIAGVTQVSYYRRGSAASHLAPDQLDEDRIRSAAILHVTGITAALSRSARETVFAAMELAHSSGTLVSFDPNYRAALWDPPGGKEGTQPDYGQQDAPGCFREMASRSDIVLTSEEEARMMVGEGSLDVIAAAIAELGPSQILIKRGSLGAFALIDGSEHLIEGARVATVDPVGAGDAFAAGYLSGLLRERAPSERLELAATVAGFVVAGIGDWEPLPTRAELDLAAAPEGHVAR